MGHPLPFVTAVTVAIVSLFSLIVLQLINMYSMLPYNLYSLNLKLIYILKFSDAASVTFNEYKFIISIIMNT